MYSDGILLKHLFRKIHNRCRQLVFSWQTQRIERKRQALILSDQNQSRAKLEPILAGMMTPPPTKTVWLLASLTMIFDFKMTGLMSWIYRSLGYAPVVIGTGNPVARAYYEMYGLRDVRDIKGILQDCSPSDRICAFISSRSLEPDLTISDFMELKYREVAVGRIVLSGAIYRSRAGTFDFHTRHCRDELHEALCASMRRVDVFFEWLEKDRPDVIVVSERGMSPWAELAGVAMQYAIPLVQYVGAARAGDFILKRITVENQFKHPLALEADVWNTIRGEPWTDEQSEQVVNGFRRAYENGSWFNRRLLQTNKRMYTKVELQDRLGLDRNKKNVVIFSHVLWDATFFYGKGLYETYEKWLIATVKEACKNNSVNWIIKLHPDLVWKMRQECHDGTLHDLVALKIAAPELPSNMVVVPPETDINTYSFFGLTDVCVTVRGTIGMEMAAHGIPVITAGTGRYSGMGFTLDSESIAEYLQRLAEIHHIEPLSVEKTVLAQKYADAVFRRRPWTLRSFSFTRSAPRFAGDPLDHNLQACVPDWETFITAADIQQIRDWIVSEAPDYICDDGDIWSVI